MHAQTVTSIAIRDLCHVIKYAHEFIVATLPTELASCVVKMLDEWLYS